MANNFYKVNAGDVPLPTDVNQYADAFQGNADVGALNFADTVPAPSTAPTATAVSGSGLGVGTYKYAFTYVTGYKKSNGTFVYYGETNLSPVATVTTTSGNQKVNLTNISQSSAPYVIARRIYRTKVGGSTYYKVAEISDNVTTTFTDTTPDASLTVLGPSSNTTGTGFTKLNIGTMGNMGNMNVKYYGGHLHVENNNGYVFNDALTASYLCANAYWDGANWNRYDTSVPAAALVINRSQEPQFRSAGSGANPISWNLYNIFHEGNFTTRTHAYYYLNTAQTLTANSWNRIKFDTKVSNLDYLNEFDTTNWYFVAANTGIYAVTFSCRVTGLSTQQTGSTLRVGTNQLNRAGMAADGTQIAVASGTGTVNISGSFIHYMSAGTQLELRIFTDNPNASLATGQANTWVVISRIA